MWLLPFFIPVICVMGSQGTLVPGLVGPIDQPEDVAIMEMYLRYESGCETGPPRRMLRWIEATPARPLYPQYWDNLKVVDGTAEEIEAKLMEKSRLAWRRP